VETAKGVFRAADGKCLRLVNAVLVTQLKHPRALRTTSATLPPSASASMADTILDFRGMLAIGITRSSHIPTRGNAADLGCGTL
jgi:hypothetical protein